MDLNDYALESANHSILMLIKHPCPSAPLEPLLSVGMRIYIEISMKIKGLAQKSQWEMVLLPKKNKG